MWERLEMENISNKHQTVVSEGLTSSSKSLLFLKRYFLTPSSAGIMGFAAFFSLILFTKLFSYVFGINSEFSLGIADVFNAAIGFVLVFSYKFLENFKTD